MKYYFIINPKAGKGGHADDLGEKIQKVCDERNITYEIYYTKAVGDATDFVKGVCAVAENLPARFYACGGDGTVGEVVNGVAGTDGASVGIIPVGTGNDFVRNFTSEAEFFDISSQIDGREEKIDLLRCNDSYAINMINIGFDCEVVKKKEAVNKCRFIPSKLAYILGVVVTLIKKPGVCASISCDGSEPIEKRCLLTTFANGCFCGGGFHSNPRAVLRDGRLDALFVNNVSRTKFVSLVGSYKKGTHLVPKNDKILKSLSANVVEMKFSSKQSASVDGEIFDFDELRIECIPDAIDIVVPAGVDFIKPRADKKEEVAV